MLNVVVEGDVEQPFASVTIISYVPAQSPVKEYVESPAGKTIGVPPFKEKLKGPVPPLIIKSSAAIQSPAH